MICDLVLLVGAVAAVDAGGRGQAGSPSVEVLMARKL